MSYIKSKDGDHHQEIDSNQKVDFGFKKVDINQKTNLVKDIFSTVAPKYDIMNDAMSFGIQRLWKNKMIETLFAELQIKNHQHNLLKILDVASEIASTAEDAAIRPATVSCPGGGATRQTTGSCSINLMSNTSVGN